MTAEIGVTVVVGVAVVIGAAVVIGVTVVIGKGISGSPLQADINTRVQTNKVSLWAINIGNALNFIISINA